MTDSTLHVLAISGSLRRASYNTALLRAAVTESMKIDNPTPLRPRLLARPLSCSLTCQ